MKAYSSHNHVLRAALVGTTALAALLATPLAAQTAAPSTATKVADASTANGGDIVVTAQFRSQKLQDVPLAITATNAALLESRSQTSIAEVARQAPNVVLVPGGASFGPALGAQIRGVGQFDFNPAYEPGVGVYVDDVYFPTLTGSIFDLLDLDRVEILRGPQGTLTGRNSIGGAIKLFSKKPDANTGGFFEAGYGSRNRLDLRGGANFKLADNLFMRISGVHKEQAGFVDQIDYGCANPGNAAGIAANRTAGNCLVDKLGAENYSAVRSQLRYQGDKLEVNLSADYTNIDHTNPAEVLTLVNSAKVSPTFLCGQFCTYASFNTGPGGPALGTKPTTLAVGTVASNRQTFKGYGFSGNINYDVAEGMQVQSITAYRHYDSTFGTDDDFTPGPLAAQGNNKLNHRFFSQELRFNAKIGTFADLTVGGYYSDQKTVYYTQQDIRYIIPGTALQFYGNDPVNADSKALFGTLVLHPIENLNVTGGVRYTKESKDYTFVRLNYDGTINGFLDPNGQANGAGTAGALNGSVAKYSGSKVDYRLSVDYRISDALMVYATTSTGFKGGGVSARPFNATQALKGSFQPETLTAYEIGAKTDLFDRMVRLNLSAFINNYKNVQLPLRDCSAYGGGPCGVVANAGDAQFKGFEAELAVEPVAGLNFDGSLSYLDAKWKSLAAAVGTSYSLTDRATSAPAWKWSAGVQYEADLGSTGSITPRFDISYGSERLSGRALGTPYFLPGYTLANARVTWRNEGKDLSVSGEITNLFDKYYYLQRFDAVYAFSGTGYSEIGHPREWKITVQKKF